MLDHLLPHGTVSHVALSPTLEEEVVLGAGAYPSCHSAKRGVHLGHVRAWDQN